MTTPRRVPAITSGHQTEHTPNPLGLPADLRRALQSLRTAVLGHGRDWSWGPEDAWICAILAGTAHRAPGELEHLAEQHGWTPQQVEMLRTFQRAMGAALGDPGAARPLEFPSRRAAAEFLAGHARRTSPRYAMPDGIQMLLDMPGTVEHAYRSALAANPGAVSELLARLVVARNLLETAAEEGPET